VTLLPVSGTALAVREPTGADELYLVETSLPPLAAFLGLARRVARTVAGDPLDWANLPAADIDAAALEIRRSWIGDMIRTDTRCPGHDCRERIDVSFSIADYIRHHRPRRPRGLTQAPGEGWFTLSGAGAPVRFRLPTVADLLTAASQDRPAETLSYLCINASELSRALARRLDRALSALAPSLEDFLGGICPACGHQVTMRFDPLTYALAELRSDFSGIYRETHVLAAVYGWPEAAILALPRTRRQRYASIIADERPSA
jgi:hypothetical protein